MCRLSLTERLTENRHPATCAWGCLFCALSRTWGARGCPEAAVFGQGRIARPARRPALHLLLICSKESVYL